MSTLAAAAGGGRSTSKSDSKEFVIVVSVHVLANGREKLAIRDAAESGR
jgi:hypothetical protein